MIFEMLVRAKGIYDGCKSISEMISALEKEIKILKELQLDKIEVAAKIDDDYAFLRTEDLEVAKKHGEYMYNIDEDFDVNGRWD